MDEVVDSINHNAKPEKFDVLVSTKLVLLPFDVSYFNTTILFVRSIYLYI